MPKPTHDLHLDFETFCELDLKKVGVHRYVAHPSFKVMCVAWKIDDRATLVSGVPQRLPTNLTQMLKSPDYQGHAWNAAFETAVLERLEVFVANPLSCTMQRALAYGLPGKLEAAAAALGMAAQKNMTGHRLMLKMSRPLKEGASDWTREDYQTLGDYCIDDVDAEAALAAVIPELQPDERELSALDAAMNVSGELGTDLHRVLNLKMAAEAAEKVDAARCAELTEGAVTSPGTQTARLLAWLSQWISLDDIPLPDVARTTIEEALTYQLPPVVREVLEIRLRMARASTRKLQRMLDMTGTGGSLKGQFQFVGAGRTGRWSGRGVQVQNLPRVPRGFSPDLFCEMARVAPLFGGLDKVVTYPVLDCVSWSLRSCLKATDDDKVLWSFDFSQIEARVLAWLAGQRDVLAVFASGEDVYVWAARQFGSNDRQLGKVLILALGFGMGATKLRDTAQKSYGVTLSAGQAEQFKTGWRSANQHIVRFWYETENAAKMAILNRGLVFPVGGSGVAFTSTARTLQMRLPSGRVLYYHKPQIDRETGNVIYWGAEVGGRWVEQRTWGGKLAENATQAAARDIMSEAMLRVYRRLQLVPVMTVHDELVYAAMADAPPYALQHLYDLMLEPPPWAGGLPLAGESKIMWRYSVGLSPGTVAKSPQEAESITTGK